MNHREIPISDGHRYAYSKKEKMNFKEKNKKQFFFRIYKQEGLWIKRGRLGKKNSFLDGEKIP